MILGIVVTVATSEAELAADVLWSLGVVAIEERAAGDDVELWTSLGEDAAVVTAALDDLPAHWPWRLVEVDETVANTWRTTAQPTWVDSDLVIVPEWVAFDAPDGALVIRIEPGATFGLGDHPTTQLTMLQLRTVINVGDGVLDVGCGSGVLAVGGCLFGAARAVAIDISPAAVPTTEHNAQTNGVADRIDVSTTPLEDVTGTFDVVLANILAPALIALADDLKRVLAPGGHLVISGILADRHDHVLAALAPLQVRSRIDLNGWTALTLS